MEILVAEDDETTRFKLVKFIEDWGFEPIQVDNGLDALEKISVWDEPGLAIIDWEMPGLQGIEVCREARKDPRMKNSYFIMLTTRDKHEDMMIGFESGVDDYLSKPFSKDELRARINAGERIVRLERELERRAVKAENRYLELFRTDLGGIIELEYPDGNSWISDILVKDANPTIMSTFGYGKSNDHSINLQMLVHRGDHAKIESMLNGKNKDLKEEKVYEIRFVGKDGEIIWTSCKPLHLSKGDGGTVSAALQVKNITKEKKEHQERMKKILSYDLDEGQVYLIFESKLKSSMGAFRELISIGYHGTAISRRTRKELSPQVKCDYDHYWLADTEEKHSIKPDIDTLLEMIDDLPNKEIIFMDRMDYLISRNSFKEVLRIVQSLKDHMVLNDSIAILSVDQATISEREKVLLLKECNELQSIFKENISIDLFNILRSVLKNDLNHIDPSMKVIEDELGISRPTARKRINRLVDFGYLLETLKGREKIYQLTDKGNSIVSKD